MRRYKTECLKDTLNLLKKSQSVQFPYMTHIGDVNLVILKDVFNPDFFNDTALFGENLRVSQGESVLEIGSGSGYVIIKKKLEGAGRAVAIDINHHAVRCTAINALLNNVVVEVKEGNLFEPLVLGDKFDVIFWNTPFALVPKNKRMTILERAVADPDYEATEAFISGARTRLTATGRLVIGFSSTLGHYNELKKLLRKYEYTLNKTHRFASEEVRPVYFQLIEARIGRLET